MEKLFHPNKWFVGFCALLIVVFFALQYVVSERLQGLAKAWGEQVFTWDWPGVEQSKVTITKTELVKRTDVDAVLKVTGTQLIERVGATDPAQAKSETECGALLTFYKSNNEWVLGKVELQ